MPRLVLSREQFATSRQTAQARYVKIELLNYKFQVVDSLEGRTTGGSINIDSNSDIRRTGSIELVIGDSTFDVQPGGKIFIDKYLRIWVGTYSLLQSKVVWTNCGIYIIDSPSYHYEAASNTLTLSLMDLMGKLTGARNGFLPGVPVKFKAGERIRDIVIALVKKGGFNNYIVSEFPEPGTLPYDLEFGQGSPIYEVLKGVVDIYPNYEMFFDVNGTFICQPRPTGEDDPVVVDDSLWDAVSTVEDIQTDFANVKNVIEIYGRTHEPAHFAIETTALDNVITLNIPTVSSYSEGLIYGFTLTDNPGYKDFKLKINDLEAYPVLLGDDKTQAEIKAEQGEVYYCVQFRGDHWYWLGHLQAYAFIEDTNPKSPYYVEGTTGRIRLPLFGDKYDNIFSDELAQERAEYELYLHSKMNDSVTLTCVPVYWLDVNILAKYTLQRSKTTQIFIIKSINLGLSPTDTMTVNMIRYYPNVIEE